MIAPMPALALATITLVASMSSAAERPLLLPADGMTAAALDKRAQARAVEVAHAPPEPDIAAESALAEVRPLYRDMAFARAVQRLTAAEQSLIDARMPAPRLANALADIQLWLGACLLLDNKVADAHERFALARALAPSARPDKIFPPEVHAAFKQAVPGARVTPRLQLSPPGARLWIDGKPATETTTAGLHWIVVERADRKPVARVMRVTQAAPEINVSLADPAGPDDVVRQAAARVAVGRLGDEEGLAVSAALQRVVWVVGDKSADRYAAGDAVHPTRHVDYAANAGSPVDALCLAEPACAPLPVEVKKPKPIYKRAALWVPVAAAAVVIAGAVVLGVTLSNQSRDYVVNVH
jgi:hypothetical protein